VRARFGSFSIDTELRRLDRDGVELHLTPKAFDLLALLIQAAPKVASKPGLHARLWPDSFVADATLVGLVKEIRRVLEQRGDAPIRTYHRVGYAFSESLDALEADPVFGSRRQRLAASRSSRPAGTHWIVRGQNRRALVEGENIIGREPSSAIWLDVVGVSRRHARVTVRGSSATLEDLGSKNGTLRGGERVTAAVPLRDADRIQIATVVLVYRASTHGVSTTRTRQRPLRKRGHTAKRRQ